ncbi:MAG: transglutaminase-like domain-containing protein [Gemmataceae bacterium]|nr:transglutaminase-like domain-containing protein [Gemmataceae bacterium]
MPRCLLLLLLASAAQAQGPRLFLEAKDARRVVGTLAYSPSAPRLAVKEWIVFAASLPELPGQHRVSSKLAPGGKPAQEKGGRAVLVARVPGKGKGKLDLSATYEATLRSRRLKPLPAGRKPPAVSAPEGDERKKALASTASIDHASPAFKAWLADKGFRREEGESDLDLGRRVFLGLKRLASYRYDAAADRKASAVCRTCRSDCGGLANVLVAALRANGVPARTLWGRWAASAKPGEKLGGVPWLQWHVKAEFFAEGVGWVPADVSQAVLHDRTPAGLRYFGQDEGDFIVFHVDADLELDTYRFGLKTLPNLQSPAYWAAGTGSFDGATATEGWTVRTAK